MIARKIEHQLDEWICNPRHALLVSGARQVGKTFSIRRCLQNNNCHYIELNLIQNQEFIAALKQAQTVDELKLNITALADFTFIDYETYLFIDEVQKCPDIVTKIKFWVDDGRVRLILSGSLLGVELRNLRSAPVGYLEEFAMYPLDYEEFLMASGVKTEVIDYLKECYVARKPVSDVIHRKMMTHLARYLVIGGMPDAVNTYVETGNVQEVTRIQENILRQYKLDFTKYESDDKKLMLTSIFDQIPSQLLKQNKRFNYADIQKGLRFERLENSFLWLKYAGVAITVVNSTEPRVSLNQNAKSSLVKLYSSDVGLLTCQYGNAFRAKVLLGDASVNLGGVYENYVAQELHAHGYTSYYYLNHRLGELDFVIEHDNTVLPIEVKSGKDYYVHSAISKAVSNEEYRIKEACVFANCNVEIDGKIIYYPIYMCTFLKDEIEYPILSLDI